MSRSPRLPRSDGTEPRTPRGTLVRMARSSTRSDSEPQKSRGEDAPNPVWFKPVMFGFMILGFVWIVVFYVSGQQLPVASLGNWNILVGFGILFIGFIMTTRWR
jgi:hypothetical protein